MEEANNQIPFDVKLINAVLFLCEHIMYVFLLFVALDAIQVIKFLVAYSYCVSWCRIILWLYMAHCVRSNPFSTRGFIYVLLDLFCAVVFSICYF